MLDTNIFNRVLDYKVPLEHLAECVEVYVTHVQEDELDNTKRSERRTALKQVLVGLDPDRRPTESFVWDVSRWDLGKWTEDDNLYDPIRAELDERLPKKNNIQDALIAETAIKNGYTLVTEDRNLREVAAGFGANCMTFEELQQDCRK